MILGELMQNPSGINGARPKWAQGERSGWRLDLKLNAMMKWENTAIVRVCGPID